MKKIINGQIYDTETAKEVIGYTYSHLGDFNYVEETLYKTQKGNYFLSAYGGAASKYCTDLGNEGYGSGETIIAMTGYEALEWIEEREDSINITEDIINEFADLLESA